MSGSSRSSSNWTIVCDFDGTIALSDVTDQLLERFADPQWRELEKSWKAGAIGSRECLMRQTELLAMTADDLKAALAGVVIDPDFAAFAVFAEKQHCTVRIASEGYTQVIHSLLARSCAPSLPVSATYMLRNGRNHWMLGTPFSDKNCSTHAATCKCTVAREGRPADAPVLVIGDGGSDFCVAAKADFVFARGKLLDYCRAESLPHAAVTNFAEATTQLAALLAMERHADKHAAGMTEQRYG